MGMRRVKKRPMDRRRKRMMTTRGFLQGWDESYPYCCHPPLPSNPSSSRWVLWAMGVNLPPPPPPPSSTTSPTQELMGRCDQYNGIPTLPHRLQLPSRSLNPSAANWIVLGGWSMVVGDKGGWKEVGEKNGWWEVKGDGR